MNLVGVLAFVAYVVAAVIFCLSATDSGDVNRDWGFFCIAAGLALSMLGGVYATVTAGRGQ